MSLAYAPYPAELLELLLAPVILRVLCEDGGNDFNSALVSLRVRYNLHDSFFDSVGFEAVNIFGDPATLDPPTDQVKTTTHDTKVSCDEAEALRRLEARWLDRKAEFFPMLDDEPSKSWMSAQAELLGIEATLSHRGGPVSAPTAGGGSWMGFLGAKIDWVVSLLERDDLLGAAAAITVIACGDFVSFDCGFVTLQRTLNSFSEASSESGGIRAPPPQEWRDRKDGSLLHHAASARAVRLLVDLIPGFGAPPSAPGSDALFSSLLESSQNGELGGGLVGHRQREGYTPLHLATTAAQAKALVARGASVESVTNGGMTCLFCCRTAPLAQCLLSLGADPSAKSLYQHTALHLAASHGLWEVVWFLLAAGGDATHKGLDGHTPLTLAERILQGVPRTTPATGARAAAAAAAAGGGGESAAVSLPANRKDLTKTFRILSLWDAILREDAANPRASRARDEASDNGDGDGGFGDDDNERHRQRRGVGAAPSAQLALPVRRAHKRLFLRLEAAVAAATHALVARDPASALARATGIPDELAALILGRYVSVFSGARDLMDDDDEEELVDGEEGHEALVGRRSTRVASAAAAAAAAAATQGTVPPLSRGPSSPRRSTVGGGSGAVAAAAAAERLLPSPSSATSPSEDGAVTANSNCSSSSSAGSSSRAHAAAASATATKYGNAATTGTSSEMVRLLTQRLGGGALAQPRREKWRLRRGAAYEHPPDPLAHRVAFLGMSWNDLSSAVVAVSMGVAFFVAALAVIVQDTAVASWARR